jgi:uncharacterized protein (DUF111 family)
VVTVMTRYGQVRVKRGFTGDRITILSPEYEDCRRRAQAAGVPMQVIHDEARRAADQQGSPAPGESSSRPGA